MLAGRSDCHHPNDRSENLLVCDRRLTLLRSKYHSGTRTMALEEDKLLATSSLEREDREPTVPRALLLEGVTT